SDKIGNVCGDEETEINNAIDEIKKKRKELKYEKGKGGKINDIDAQIYNLNDEMNKIKISSQPADGIAQKVFEKEKEIEALNKSLSEYENKSKLAREMSAVKDRAENYKTKSDEYKQLAEQIERQEKVFSRTDVGENEIRQVYDKLIGSNRDSDNLSNLQSTIKANEKSLAEIKGKYLKTPDGVLVGELNNIKSGLDLLDSTAESQESVNKPTKADNKLPLILLATLSVLAVVGGILLVFVVSVVGYILIGLGAVGLILSLIKYVNGIARSTALEAVNRQSAANENFEAQKLNLNTRFIKLTTEYGISSSNIEEVISSVSKDVEGIRSLTSDMERYKKSYENTTNQINGTKKEI
ncbi:MAG: hypothetical protein MJ072_06805, partial [Clostridia bacterium]|nr:hypothetical protein [Clostridia bacterium]